MRYYIPAAEEGGWPAGRAPVDDKDPNSGRLELAAAAAAVGIAGMPACGLWLELLVTLSSPS